MHYVNQILLRTDFFLQNVNRILKGRILFQICADRFDSMKNRGMITAAQCLTDILQTGFCHSTAQIHHDLARINNFFASFCRHDIKRGEVKMIGNDLNDEFRSNFLLVAWGNDIF